MSEIKKVPNLPSNSRESIPRPKSVIEGAQVKKKSGLDKFCELFFDGPWKETRERLVKEVLVPAAKDVAIDAISSVLGRPVGRYLRNATTGARAADRSYTQYGSVSRTQDNRPVANLQAADYQPIVFMSLGDADRVFDEMLDWCERYGQVSVNDMYDMAGLTLEDHTVARLGWIKEDPNANLRKGSVYRTRDGEYMLDLPRPVPLGR